MKKRMWWTLPGTIAVAAMILFLSSCIELDGDSEGVMRIPDATALAEALDQAAPGSILVVERTAEPIKGPLVIEASGVTLRSAQGRGRIQGTGSEPALLVLGNGVTIEGFDISSESIGIRVESSDCTLRDLNILSAPIGVQLTGAARCNLDSVSLSAGEIGIELIDTSNVVIQSASISGASAYGVRLLRSRANELLDLTLVGAAVGISLEQASIENLIENCSISRCSIAGIEIRASNGNTIIGSTIDLVRIGILLEAATDTVIRDGEITGSVVSGILLQQAIQNEILQVGVLGCEGTGIQLTQSKENAILYNRVVECLDAGLGVVSGSKNLIMGNDVISCPIGISLVRCDATRVLRNTVSQASGCAILLSEGKTNRVLDNTVRDGSYGLVVSNSIGNTVLRNSVRDASKVGLALIGTQGDNTLSENTVEGCHWGLLLLAPAYDRITYNNLTRNDVGVEAVSTGTGVRVEGNEITRNRIGMRLQNDVAAVGTDLEQLGISIPTLDNLSAPIVTNNFFQNSAESDIENGTSLNLPAAGNWWGVHRRRDASAATVVGAVLLDQSVWAGTVAVGSGSDDVRVLLGRLLQQAFVDEGFQVIDLIGLGTSSRVQQAILDADVDLIWWSHSDRAGDPILSASAITIPTSVNDGWRIVVSQQIAAELPTLSSAGLADWAAPGDVALRFTAMTSLDESSFQAYLEAYGLQNAVRSMTKSDALEEVEALLKFGAVDVAIVGKLEETLTLAGFSEISDERDALDQDEILIVVQQSVLRGNAKVQEILDGLAERLTSDALHDLVTRVKMLGEAPEDVARGFLDR